MHIGASADSRSYELATDTGQNILVLGGMTLLGLIILMVLCVYLFASVLSRGSLRAPTEAGSWREASVACVTVALALYVYGVLCVLRLENAYHTCTLERFGDPNGSGSLSVTLTDSEDSLVPVGSVCEWTDGYTLDFVPWFVNPAIGVLLAAAVGSAVLAVMHREDATADEGRSARPE